MKAEPQPNCDVSRASGTDSDNGCWLRRLVRRLFVIIKHEPKLLGLLVVDTIGLAFVETAAWRHLGCSSLKVIYLMFRDLL